MQYGKCDTVYGKLPEKTRILSSHYQVVWKLFPLTGSALNGLILIL